MSYCEKCGNKTRPGELACRQCGNRLVPASVLRAPGAGPDVSREELAMFVGKNADVYLRKFRSFTENGDAFTVTWHWPAFFFTFWWTLYRKMYGWAILVFFLGCVPYVGLLAMIVFGISGNYLYYRHAKKKVIELRAVRRPETEQAAAIGRAGGVNNVAIVLAPILIVMVVAILAAIAIPQFAMYRQRAADLQAKREIQDACRIGQTIFSENPSKELIEPDELLYAGLVRTPDVEMTLLDGRRAAFSITAGHKHGKTFYRTDSQCFLTEELQTN